MKMKRETVSVLLLAAAILVSSFIGIYVVLDVVRTMHTYTQIAQ